MKRFFTLMMAVIIMGIMLTIPAYATEDAGQIVINTESLEIAGFIITIIIGIVFLVMMFTTPREESMSKTTAMFGIMFAIGLVATVLLTAVLK